MRKTRKKEAAAVATRQSEAPAGQVQRPGLLASLPDHLFLSICLSGLTAEDLARLEGCCRQFRRNLGQLVANGAEATLSEVAAEATISRREDGWRVQKRRGESYTFLLSVLERRLSPLRSLCGGAMHSMVMAQSELFACGWNQHRQLGFGASEQPYEITWEDELEEEEDLDEKYCHDTLMLVHLPPQPPVAAIGAGDDHSAALLRGGRLLSWGSADDGQLGIDMGPLSQVDSVVVAKPRHVHELRSHTVAMLSCGPHHTACVTAEGDLFTWGCNIDGELGHGASLAGVAVLPLPRRVESVADERIVEVSCGLEVTSIITVSGKLSCCGFIPIAASRSPAEHIPHIRDLYGIRCSQSGASLVYEEWWYAKPGLWRTGPEAATRRELGIGADFSKSEYEKLHTAERQACVRLESLEHAKAVMSPEEYHRYAIVHGWVASQALSEVFIPETARFERPPELAARGHGRRQDQERKQLLVALASFEADKSNRLWPLPHTADGCPSAPVRSVACDGNFFAVIERSSARVLTWGMCTGSNEEDEWGLGHGPLAAHGRAAGGAVLHRPRPLDALANIRARSVDCGLAHMACVTESGEVYTWGRGMHGQLGHKGTNDRLLPTQVVGLSAVTEVSCGDSHTLVRSNQPLNTRARALDAYMRDGVREQAYAAYMYAYDQLVQSDSRAVSVMYGHNVPPRESGDDAATTRGGSGVFIFGKGNDGQLGLGNAPCPPGLEEHAIDVTVPMELCCDWVRVQAEPTGAFPYNP